MVKKINQSDMNCSDVQMILSINDDRADMAKVSAHLDQCADCMAYKKTVNSLEKIYSLDTKVGTISPQESVKRNLITSMKNLSKERDSLWGPIWRLFEYRIPVYQAVTGVAIIFIIFFAAQKISWQTSDMPSVTNIKIEIDKSDFPELFVLDSLKIKNLHNLGRNALEDSAITKYMVTAL